MTLEITEAERQTIILALSRLSVERPGWDFLLNGIACKMDNVSEERAVMYDQFRKLEYQANPPTVWERLSELGPRPLRTP
jgi:hypothetical protein